MGYHDVTLDSKFIGYGSVAGPGHRTFIPETQGGIDEGLRVSRWGQARRQLTLSNSLEIEDVQELFSFILIRRGSAHSFNIRDPLDFTTASDQVSDHAFDDIVIGTGDGTKTEFTLKKIYVDGSTTVTRIINRPVVGKILIGVNGVLQVENTDYTVDHSIGRISFLTAPTNTHSVTAGFEFRIGVRFGKSVDDLLGLSYNGFREADYTIDLIEDIVPIDGAVRPQWYNGLIEHGGGTSFGDNQISPFVIDFQFGRWIRFTQDSNLIIILPDIDTTISGVGSLFANDVVTAGGPYFGIYNDSFGSSITAQEWFGGSLAAIQGDSVWGPGRLREFFIDDGGRWRAR